jgi:galactokinase
VWAAPGRVNLIGEHTDYNDGFVLPMAISKRVFVAAGRRTDGALRLASLQQPGEHTSLESGAGVSGWARYVAGVAWVFREAGHPILGADLLVDGHVPIGAGLSSSAALECATALMLNDLYGCGLTATTLATLARRAENEFVGVPCGPMDQLAAMHGQNDRALFIDTRSLAIEPVPLDLAAAGLELLVINTNAPHALAAGEYADRRRACENAARALRTSALRDLALEDLDAALSRLDDPTMRKRVRHVVTENARVLETVALLRRHRPEAIGPLLTASHLSLRDDYEVSSPELDTAVDAALGAGALGARLTGAGFGGCAIALVRSSSTQAIVDAATQAFRGRPFSPPDCFTVVPSDGACRHSGQSG